ncbi:MAG: AMP-binding protein, partial [Desulfamplus sp.]|nr:AMP-binding protein [Desulfamplus sp.]
VMKEINALLAELDLLDIKLRLENGALRYNAPKGALTPYLREQLGTHKQEIIAILSQTDTFNDAPIPLQPRGKGLPLSTAQQRFWFLDQLDHGNSSAFNMPPIVIRLNGFLYIEALQQSLDEIIRRHEVLRTVFHMEDGMPVQVCVENIKIAIPVHDIRTLDENEQQEEIKKITLNEAATPFDLKNGGILLRVVLVQTQDREHYFILTMHHIIADGWSIGIFVREIGLLYREFLNNGHALTDTTKNESLMITDSSKDFHINTSPYRNVEISNRLSSYPLPPLPIQYADYACWERTRLESAGLIRQKRYWLEQLEGAPTLLELPTDHPRPRIRRNHGRSEHFYIEPDIADKLKLFCKESGLTPYMALLASFGVLLCRYTGQEEIVIGSPISVRPHSQTEPLIGLFLNTLVLRIDMTQNPSFSELAQRVKKIALEAYQNSEFPFDMLLQELNLERSLNHTPLFQVLFALQNAPMGPVELEGLTITPMPPGEELISPFDLVLSIDDTTSEGGISGKFRYNTDLFEAHSIIRLTGHYKNLLENMLSNPNEPVRYLPMISDQELYKLKKWAGGTLTDGVQVGKNFFPVTETLPQIFERVAAKHPDSIALCMNDTKNNNLRLELTYRELNEHANRLAHRIMSLNTDVASSADSSNNIRIGLCMERSIELVIGILAIIKAGAAYVPLDPAYPDDRLSFIVKDAGIKIIVGSPELVMPLELQSVTVVNPADILSNSNLATDNLAAANNDLVTVNHDNADSDMASDSLTGFSSSTSFSSDNPACSSSPESIAYVIYTSGSTGVPKGVLVTHANVVRLFTGTDQLFGFTDKDVWTLFHSFAFDFSVWELWGALLYGGRLVVIPYGVSRSPDAFYNLLKTEGVTVLNQTPSAFRQLIEVDNRIAEVNNRLTQMDNRVIQGDNRVTGADNPATEVDTPATEVDIEASNPVQSVDQKSLTLKWVIFGGEALEPRTLQSWVQRHGLEEPELINMYGITETTVHVTFHRLTHADIKEGGSPIGRSLPDLSIHLVDSLNQIVPIGVAGEMLVGGAGVAKGYLNREELTSTRFVDSASVGIDSSIGTLYRSGDLARWLPGADGVLEYLGRMDMQVKIRGFRIELGEIEGCLVSHPQVREAVVEPRKSSKNRSAS